MGEGLDDAADVVDDHVVAATVVARPSRPANLASDVPEGCCANCRTALEGPVCHQCGQIADGYHRPVLSLIREGLEGLLAFDGRLANTLPDLMGRPGRVTRRFLSGERARFIPPFRLYLVASLLFFLLMSVILGDLDIPDDGSVRLDSAQWREELETANKAGDLSDEELQRVEEALAEAGLVAADGDGEASVSAPPDPPRHPMAERWQRVADDPQEWLDETIAWIPRIMFVMVPVYALLLALTYVWRRRFFFYDHLIVSLHFHAALFIAMTVGALIGLAVGPGWVITGLIVYSNAYLYRIHRTVYGRSRFTSVLRTLFMDLVYFFLLLIALLGVIILGLISV